MSDDLSNFPWYIQQYRILMGVFIASIILILVLLLYIWFRLKKQMQQAEARALETSKNTLDKTTKAEGEPREAK